MKKIFLGMIRFYQKYLSPLKGHGSCKYTPTCSQYAYEAIRKYGCVKGLWQSGECFVAIRLLRADMILFPNDEGRKI